jgi:hypothetical protein
MPFNIGNACPTYIAGFLTFEGITEKLNLIGSHAKLTLFMNP